MSSVPAKRLDLYREALVEAEGDDALEAEIQLGLAYFAQDTENLAHAERAVQAASRARDAALLCRALATFGRLHFREGRGASRKRMEEALALERSLPPWPLTRVATTALAFQLVWSGELERARGLLEESREALNAQDDINEGAALWLLSLLEWRAGNWDVAARHAADSLALRAQFGHEGDQPLAELPAAMIAAHQGRIEEARDRSERALALAEAEDIRIAQSGHCWVLGFLDLSLGDAAAALGYLERAWDIRDSVSVLEPGYRLELADTLEALIAVGELAEAERKLATWEQRARALDRSWALAITARCRALLLAARGDLGGRPGGLPARSGRARADSGSLSARADPARARRHTAASEAARRRSRRARACARHLRAARRPALGSRRHRASWRGSAAAPPRAAS